MLLKWLAAFFQHGLASVAALLAGVAAIWWVEPTTTGGIAFLFFMVFILALAVIELGLRFVRSFRTPPPAAAETPASAPTVDAPAPASTTVEPPAEPSRSSRS
jgi:Na+-transporting methylmalonyl-CoA/oxaloacetate decarboxylase gamma subunit